MKRILLALFILTLIFGGVFGWKHFINIKTREYMAHRVIPPVTVAAMDASTDVWQPSLVTTGELEAISHVEVTGEIAGKITEIYFESGDRVEKGELLARMDCSTEKAELKRMEAVKRLSKIQLDRILPLVKTNAAPQAQLDKARAEYQQSGASVESQKCLIAKKEIEAPFSGELGLRKVNPGQYLKAGTALVSLQSLDPLYLNFSLPQQNLDKIKRNREVIFTVDTWPGREFRGKISAIDPRINRGSRSLNVQATLSNKDGKLRPGMFGKVNALLPREDKVITIPQTAINYNPYGDVIFVLTELEEQFEGNPVYRASRKFVVLGMTRGSQVAVNKGLDPGEKVVIAGQHKLREGVKVVIDNSIIPDNSPNPRVEEE